MALVIPPEHALAVIAAGQQQCVHSGMLEASVGRSAPTRPFLPKSWILSTMP